MKVVYPKRGRGAAPQERKPILGDRRYNIREKGRKVSNEQLKNENSFSGDSWKSEAGYFMTVQYILIYRSHGKICQGRVAVLEVFYAWKGSQVNGKIAIFAIEPII